MSNQSYLNINVQKVQQQAKQLDDVASKMTSRTIKRLNDVVMNTRAAWTGDAAAAFDQIMTDSSNGMENFAKQIKNYAEQLRKIAKVAKKAQEEAKRLANM